MRPLIIAVEGIDGAGKSVAAEAAARVLGTEPVHFTAPEAYPGGHSGLFAAARALLAEAVENPGAPVLLDRGWVSMWVYAHTRHSAPEAVGEAERLYVEVARCAMPRTWHMSRKIGKCHEADPQWSAELLERERVMFRTWANSHPTATVHFSNYHSSLPRLELRAEQLALRELRNWRLHECTT